MKIKLISASENTVYSTDELRGKFAALITSQICLKTGVKQRICQRDDFCLIYMYFSYIPLHSKRAESIYMGGLAVGKYVRKPKLKLCQDYSKKAITLNILIKADNPASAPTIVLKRNFNARRHNVKTDNRF